MQNQDSAVTKPVALCELARYAIVGFSNFAIGYVTFTASYTWSLGTHFLSLLHASGLPLADLLDAKGVDTIDGFTAQCIAYAVGTANSYFWNARWTFKCRLTKTAVLRFYLLNIANLAFSAAIIFLLVDVRGWNASLTWLWVMGIVTVIGFIGSKYWVFRQ